MSYINVDQPKFFVNELQYQASIDNLKTAFWWNGVDHGEGVKTWPIYNHPEKSWPDVMQGSGGGSNYLDMYLCFCLKEGYWNDILIPEDGSGSNRYGSWFGMFGHQYAQANNYWWLRSMVEDIDDAGWAPNNGSSMSYLQNIVNAASAAGSFMESEVAGWTMAKNLYQDLEANCKTIAIRLEENIPLSCVAIGNYYSPEHSPEMGYRMSHTYDGTKFLTTRGGATFSNTYYSGPPVWASGAAWELGYIDSVGAYQNPSNVRRSGRRIFDFKWKGIGDTSLMPSNSLRTTYINDSEDSNSVDFYTQIIKKTLDQSFIFTPDGTNLDPESFMFARWDNPEIKFNQMTPKLYQFSKTIVESW